MLPTKRVNLSRIAPWLCFAFTLSLTLSTLSLSYDYSQYSLFSLCFFFFALLLLFGLVDVRRNCTKIAIPLAGQQHNSQPTINLRYYFRQCSKYICIFILVFLGVYLVYATMINRERVFVIHNNRAWRYTDLFVDVDIKAPRSPEQGKEGISAIDAVYVVSYEPMEARREVGRLASRILQSTLFLYPLLYAPLFSSQHSISLLTKFLYIYICYMFWCWYIQLLHACLLEEGFSEAQVLFGFDWDHPRVLTERQLVAEVQPDALLHLYHIPIIPLSNSLSDYIYICDV